MELARLLNGQRKERGFSKKAAATKVGIAQKTISALENNPEGGTIESLFKLLPALDLKLVLQQQSPADKPGELALFTVIPDWAKIHTAERMRFEKEALL
jgi:HTH-type transcriptional regulator/antitoxin HipB